jgi:hypothetical protein
LKKEQTGTVKFAESRLGRSRVGRVNGRDDATHWLWRAVDQDGFVLDEMDLLTVGRTPVLIGYARVSIEDQHLDLQHDAQTRAGCARTFEDRRSGAKVDRTGLAAALDYARSGDSLVVWRLDRLGRSLSDLIALVRRMEEAGVQLRSLTEGIDTSATNGKLTFHLFAALTEFERAQAPALARAMPTPSRFVKPKTKPSARSAG